MGGIVGLKTKLHFKETEEFTSVISPIRRKKVWCDWKARARCWLGRCGAWEAAWKMNELRYRVQVKVYRHIRNEVGQTPRDSEAGTECRDSWMSESTTVSDRGQEGKMREEGEVIDNSQVPLTKAEKERGIGWGWLGEGKIIYLLVEVLSVKACDLSWVIYLGELRRQEGWSHQCRCNCSK